MKGKAPFFIPLFLCFMGLNAQVGFEVQKGETARSKKHTHLSASLTNGKGGLVTVETYAQSERAFPQGYLVSYFDKNLNLKAEKKFKRKDNCFRGAMLKDETLYLFEFDRNKRTDQYDFNVLFTPLGTFDFQRKTLFSTKEVKKFARYYPQKPDLMEFSSNLESVDGIAYFQNVAFSPDKKFFGVVFNAGDSLHILVHDLNFNKVLDKTVILDKPGWNYSHSKIRLGNEGAVFLLGKHFKKEGNYDDRSQSYTLAKIDRDGAKLLEIKYPGHFLPSMTLLLKGGKLYCAGFYSEKQDRHYKGIVLYQIDPEALSLKNKFFIPLPSRFLSEKNGGKSRFGIAKAHLLDDGNIVLNTERHPAKSFHRPDGEIYEFISYALDIASFKISPEGKLLWGNIVEKKQSGSILHPSKISYGDFYKDGKAYYFFNGGKKVSDAGKVKFVNGDNLYMVAVDGDGETSHRILVEDEMDYFTEFGQKSNDGSYILMGKNGRKKQLIRIAPH